MASRGGDSQSFAPGGSAPRPAGTTTRVRGARCNRSGSNSGEGKARRPAQNRHGGAPRGERLRETHGASQGVWRAALRHAPPVHRAPERISALRHPSFRVREAKVAKPGRKNAPRERRRLFEKVSQNAFRWRGISASSELGLYPPPCGEGRREAPGWGSLLLRKARPPTPTPTPNPSPQGGGERTECAE